MTAVGTAPAAPAVAPERAEVSDRGRRSWQADLVMALGTVGITLLALIPALQLWQARADVPFSYRADGLFYTSTVQNMLEGGGYQHTDRLGAPFGQDLHDFPLSGDNLQIAAVKLLSLLSPEPGVALNGYLLLTFPLVALSALFVLRWLGVSRALAVAFAVAYAFLPYHFYRGTNHPYLSGYYAVPLAAYLTLSVLEGRRLFKRREGSTGLLSLASRRTLGTLLICAVIGSTGTYYVVFTLVFVAAAATLAFARGRSLASLGPAVVVLVAICGTLALHLAPTAIHRSEHGPNPEVAQRHASESERYGLKVASMVLPPPGHRFSPIGGVADHYAANTPLPSEGGQALGSLGTIGFLWLLGVGIFGTAGGRTPFAASPVHRRLAFLALVGVLAGTVGGMSLLFNFFVTPQIRSWNRISVFIAFFSLAALALLVDHWKTRTGRSWPGATTLGGVRTGVALVALISFAVLDQTSTSAVPPYSLTAAEFDSDRDFVRSIEAQLPAGAMVYQLPYLPFPEAQPLAQMGIYDHLRGYLHSSALRWSFGGMRGREADWQESLAGQPVDLLVSRLAAVGFDGIYIDRFGYHDSARALEADLARLLGPPLAVSRNERLSFFPLAAHKGRLEAAGRAAVNALAEQTLKPVLSRPGPGFKEDLSDGDHYWLSGGEDSALQIVNPHHSPRPVRLDATVVAGEEGEVRVSYPDGSSELLIPSAEGDPLRRTLLVPAGVSWIRFTTDGPGLTGRVAPDRTRLELRDPSIYDEPPAGISSGTA